MKKCWLMFDICVTLIDHILFCMSPIHEYPIGNPHTISWIERKNTMSLGGHNRWEEKQGTCL